MGDNFTPGPFRYDLPEVDVKYMFVKNAPVVIVVWENSLHLMYISIGGIITLPSPLSTKKCQLIDPLM